MHAALPGEVPVTIRNRELFEVLRPAGFDGLFDWDFLKPAFNGTKIEPMDLDAIVERGGKFLIFETKASGVPIPRGQQITLDRLLSDGNKTLFFLEFQVTPKTYLDLSACTIAHRTLASCRRIAPCPAAYVVAKARQWFLWASGKNSDPQEWYGDLDAAHIRENEARAVKVSLLDAHGNSGGAR